MITFRPLSPVRKAAKPAKPKSASTRAPAYVKQKALASRMANSIQVNLVSGIKTFKTRISTAALEKAWESADYQKLMHVIPWERYPEDLDGALNAIGMTATQAANLSAQSLIPLLPPNANKELRYDITNPTLRTYVGKRTGELITGIQSDTQAIVQDAISSHFTNAWTPRAVADQIKRSIGLLPKHEVAVRNLAEGLREKNYTPQNIKAYCDKYADRLLDYRAMMIARTEAKNASNYGQQAVWTQARDKGLIRADSRRAWIYDDVGPCDVCPEMDGVDVGLDEPWELKWADGSVEYVMVPSESHPHCGCSMELIFGKGKDDEEVSSIEDDQGNENGDNNENDTE